MCVLHTNLFLNEYYLPGYFIVLHPRSVDIGFMKLMTKNHLSASKKDKGSNMEKYMKLMGKSTAYEYVTFIF